MILLVQSNIGDVSFDYLVMVFHQVSPLSTYCALLCN